MYCTHDTSSKQQEPFQNSKIYWKYSRYTEISEIFRLNATNYKVSNLIWKFT